LGSEVFSGLHLIGSHSRHTADATFALKKVMEHIETSVLSETFSTSDLHGVDPCFIAIACGCLRRDDDYLKKVIRKHSQDPQNSQTGNSSDSATGLFKENMRAALIDAHFPLAHGALAASDDELMRQVDLDNSKCVSFDEFRQFVHQRGSVENWMKTEQFLQILSDSVIPFLGTDAGQDHHMRQLAQLSPDQVRRAFDAAVIGFNMRFESSQNNLKKTLKAVTEQSERLSQSKFQVSKLACGGIDDFHKGLECRIGK